MEIVDPEIEPIPPPPIAAPPPPIAAPPPPNAAPPPPRTVRTALPSEAPRPSAPPRKPAEKPRKEAPPPKAPRPPKATATPKPGRRRGFLGWVVRLGALALVLGLIGLMGVAGLFFYYSRELPTVEALGQYRPPTVTVVYDREGRVLGEIYEKRRYVVELDQIPKHVQDAFIAAEDANFWEHDGIDVGGIFRAVGRNLAKGKAAQGASTITQQVARNFLLTSEKTVTRKIKEIILARRIEDTFDKQHILYLYLNQIYLGSGAYGVEAAARTYFDKHVQDLTLAEAAILAGLPQRPSDYSPLNHWEKARARQEYVLTQLLQKGYIDQATHDATLATTVNIVNKENPFLGQAPWFTEHVRRYLVETYGFDKVYNDGLSVDTTCDLDLQKVAQKSVEDGTLRADNRVGWRGPAEHLEEGAIQARLDTQEEALRKEASRTVLRVAAQESPEGGYGPVPEISPLTAGRRYEAVVLEVAQKHAVVGIGRHRALIPLSWSAWTYKPNPDRSFKGRQQDDLTRVLTRGDVVQVTLEGLNTEEFDNLKGYTGAGPGPFAAARLYQSPELESALLSYRLEDGAVLAMVGGVDFEESEYNRATQARRQVGSTFKPIVYAAAIETKKITAGSIVQDAPLVFNVLDEKLWKPDNYGEDFLGNITLRKALQMSRNVCTIRVLDKIGLDAVFDMAGPRLRIGYDKPVCHRELIVEGEACEGSTEPSPVAGRVWCTGCEPSTCPLVETTAETSCLDQPVTEGEAQWCHSCDVNLRVCDWIAEERMPEGDRCVDRRKDADGQVWCRSCDLSMGLGSSSLTMVELTRAYSSFATYGKLVEPHWIDRVVDRDGTVIESWTPPEAWPQVIDKGVASIAHWLLVQVVQGGTASKAQRLGLNLAGKTGTTNDFFDAWFVGYNPDLITTVWVGYDQPRSMGQSFTGGETSLPIWMDYMEEAAPKDKDRPFPPLPGVESVPIDESTGRVAKGGYPIPMLPGTAPTNTVVEVGQKTSEDLLTSDF